MQDEASDDDVEDYDAKDEKIMMLRIMILRRGKTMMLKLIIRKMTRCRINTIKILK